MAQHIFSAERQLIFHIVVDGRTQLVQFGERSQWGASNFSTTDEKVAAAIKRHSMYKRGVITEFVQEDKKPAKQVRKPAGKAECTAAQQPQDTGKEGQEPPTPETPPGETDAANVIEAENFTQAREAVMKRLGIGKDAVKNPILLQQVAKEAGLTIKYNKK